MSNDEPKKTTKKPSINAAKNADASSTLNSKEINEENAANYTQTPRNSHMHAGGKGFFIEQQRLSKEIIDKQKLKIEADRDLYFPRSYQQDVENKRIAAEIKTRQALGVPHDTSWSIVVVTELLRLKEKKAFTDTNWSSAILMNFLSQEFDRAKVEAQLADKCGTTDVGELSASELSASKLSASELSASELSASELSATELSATELSATELSATELSATELSASELSATELSASELSASESNASELNASELNASELNASELNASESNASELNAGNLDLSVSEVSDFNDSAYYDDDVFFIDKTYKEHSEMMDDYEHQIKKK